MHTAENVDFHGLRVWFKAHPGEAIKYNRREFVIVTKHGAEMAATEFVIGSEMRAILDALNTDPSGLWF